MFLTRGAKIGLLVAYLVLAGVIVWLYLSSATIDSLHKTDKIACQFLNADAVARHKQAVNTNDSQVAAETAFLQDSTAILSLFRQAKPTRQNAASLRIFVNYVAAERTLVDSIRRGTAENVVVSERLAGLGMKLANQLHC